MDENIKVVFGDSYSLYEIPALVEAGKISGVKVLIKLSDTEDEDDILRDIYFEGTNQQYFMFIESFLNSIIELLSNKNRSVGFILRYMSEITDFLILLSEEDRLTTDTGFSTDAYDNFIETLRDLQENKFFGYPNRDRIKQAMEILENTRKSLAFNCELG